jgi:hypothetical protein
VTGPFRRLRDALAVVRAWPGRLNEKDGHPSALQSPSSVSVFGLKPVSLKPLHVQIRVPGGLPS